jgi:hypothetical protein
MSEVVELMTESQFYIKVGQVINLEMEKSFFMEVEENGSN